MRKILNNFSILKVVRKPIRSTIYFLGLKRYETTETYKEIIPPEINRGEFYKLIEKISSQSDVITILEIGSSSGEGSTKAIFDSLAPFPYAKKQIHCMEISRERHEKLSSYLQNDPRFYAHRMSSVLISDFPRFEDVKQFHSFYKTNLSKIHVDTVESWYRKDIKYLVDNPDLFPDDSISGINWIKQKFKIDFFDFVIIDGGEFTGFAEYEYIRGARYIALDDTNTYKNGDVRKMLLEDQAYKLVDESLTERNGWAVFEHV
jgi:hypothetical protein